MMEVTAVGNRVDGGGGTEVTVMGWTEDGVCGGGGRLREEELKLQSDNNGKELKHKIITRVPDLMVVICLYMVHKERIYAP
jgi:hypothetical protein